MSFSSAKYGYVPPIHASKQNREVFHELCVTILNRLQQVWWLLPALRDCNLTTGKY